MPDSEFDTLWDESGTPKADALDSLWDDTPRTDNARRATKARRAAPAKPPTVRPDALDLARRTFDERATPLTAVTGLLAPKDPTDVAEVQQRRAVRADADAAFRKRAREQRQRDAGGASGEWGETAGTSGEFDRSGQASPMMGLVGGFIDDIPQAAGQFMQDLAVPETMVNRQTGAPFDTGTDTREMGEAVEAYGRRNADSRIPRRDTATDYVVGTVARAIPWGLTTLAATIVGGPQAGFGTAYALAEGDISNEMQELDADGTAREWAAPLLALPLAYLERLPLDDIAGLLLRKGTIEGAKRGITITAAPTIAGAVKRTAGIGAKEAGTEVIQEEGQYVGTRLVTGQPMSADEALSRGIEAAIGGAGAGTVMGAPAVAVDARRRQVEHRQVTSPVASRAMRDADISDAEWGAMTPEERTHTLRTAQLSPAQATAYYDSLAAEEAGAQARAAMAAMATPDATPVATAVAPVERAPTEASTAAAARPRIDPWELPPEVAALGVKLSEWEEMDGGTRQRHRVYAGLEEMPPFPEVKSEWQPGPDPIRPTPAPTPNIRDEPVSALDVEPERFQYKGNTDATTGAGSEMKSVKVWDPNLAGVVLTWRDPADNRLKVVNGHHRVELARRLGVEQIGVREMSATDAAEARTIGALANIAEGRGSAIDAAKVFRAQGTTPAMLEARGISMRGAVARDGLALARLHPTLFAEVVAERLPVARATIIGQSALEPEQQLALVQMLEQRESKGRPITNAALGELIRFTMDAGSADVTQESLFGTETTAQSLAVEKAQLSAYVMDRLGKDRRLFGFLAHGDRAARIEGSGVGHVETAKAQDRAGVAAQTEEVYSKLSGMSGPVSAALNNAARRWAQGDDRAAVRAELYDAVRTAVESELGSLAGDPAAGRTQGTDRGGEREGAEVGRDGTEQPEPSFVDADQVGFLAERGPQYDPLQSGLFGDEPTAAPQQESLFGERAGTAATRDLASTERAARAELDEIRAKLPASTPAQRLKLLRRQAELDRLVNRGSAITGDELATRARAEQDGTLARDTLDDLWDRVQEERPRYRVDRDAPSWAVGESMDADVERLVSDPDIAVAQLTDPAFRAMFEGAATLAAEEPDNMMWRGDLRVLRREWTRRFRSAPPSRASRSVQESAPAYEASEASEAPEAPETPAARKRGVTGFTSRLASAIDAAPFAKGTAEQWAAALSKNVAKGEREWTGVEQLLADNAGKVLTRDEVKAAFNDGEITLDETVLNADETIAMKAVNAAYDAQNTLAMELHDQYGDGFRLPGRMSATDKARLAAADKRVREAESTRAAATNAKPLFSGYVEPGGTNYREIVITLPENEAVTSSHFPDVKNPMVHIRVNDRTLPNGEKVLFVEEIQSDWHQQGRKRGYRDTAKDQALDERMAASSRAVAAAERDLTRTTPEWGAGFMGGGMSYWDRANEVDGDYKKIGTVGQDGYVGVSKDASPDQRDALERIAAAMKERAAVQRERSEGDNLVPDAPFKRTDEWVGLAVRRILDEAVAGGYGRVAWTTGEQQARRFDLSMQVDEITYDPESGRLEAWKGAAIVHEGTYDANALDGVIGKEVARKLLDTQRRSVDEGHGAVHQLRGDDLKVGGAGMKAFYDSLLPKVIREQAKKLGVKLGVEPTEVLAASGQPWVVGREDIDGVEILARAATREEAEAIADKHPGAEVDYDPNSGVENPSFRITLELADAFDAKGRFIMEPRGRYADPAQGDMFATGSSASSEQDAAFTPEQLAAAERALDRLKAAGLPMRPEREPGIAAANARDLTAIDLRGQSMATPRERALVMRALRHPAFEILSVFYLDAQGVVVAHESTSSGILNYSALPENFEADIVARARQLGSTRVVLGHNHPSGDPKPSEQFDVPLTWQVGFALQQQGIWLEGHVVINHDKAAWIHLGATGNEDFDFISIPPDRTATWTTGVQRGLTAEESARRLVTAMAPDALTIGYLDTQMRIVAAEALPADMIATIDQWLPEAQQRLASHWVIIGLGRGAGRALAQRVIERHTVTNGRHWADDIIDIIEVSPPSSQYGDPPLRSLTAAGLLSQFDRPGQPKQYPARRVGVREPGRQSAAGVGDGRRLVDDRRGRDGAPGADAESGRGTAGSPHSTPDTGANGGRRTYPGRDRPERRIAELRARYGVAEPAPAAPPKPTPPSTKAADVRAAFSYDDIDFSGEAAKAAGAHKGTFLDRLNRFADAIANGYGAIERLGESLDRQLRPTRNPRDLLTTVKNSDYTIARFMNEGVVDPETREIIGPSFKSMFDRFKRNPERVKIALKFVKAERDVGRGLKAMAGDEAAFARAEERVRIGRADPELRAFAADWKAFVDGIGNYAVKQGLWPESLWETIRKSDALYVRYKRILTEDVRAAAGETSAPSGAAAKRMVNVGPGVQRFEGSKLPIQNPAEAMAEYVGNIIRRADRYRVGASLFDAVDSMGSEGVFLITRIKAGDAAGHGVRSARAREHAKDLFLSEEALESLIETFDVRFDPDNPVIWRYHPVTGKKEYGQVNSPELWRSVAALSATDDSALRTLLDYTVRPLKRVFVAATTGLSPRFALATNPVRDITTLAAQTRGGISPLSVVKAYALGFASEVGAGSSRFIPKAVRDRARKAGLHTDLADEAKAWGLGNVSMYRNETAPKTVARRVAPTSLMDKIRTAAGDRNPGMLAVRALERFGDASDKGPRLAEYMASLRRNEPRVTSGEWTLADLRLRAATESRPVTLDFSNKPGNPVVRFFADYIPFFGVALQAPVVLARSGRRAPARVAGVAASVAMTAVMAWSLKHLLDSDDDEELYKKINDRTSEERASYILVPIDRTGSVLRIPLPQEFGFLAAVVTGTLDKLFEDDPHAADLIATAAIRLSPPGLVEALEGIPPLPGAQQIAENSRNRKVFGDRPIEPRSMLDLPVAERRFETTSPTFDMLAAGLRKAGFDKTSPLKAENLVRGVTSSATPLISTALDPIASRVTGRNTPRASGQPLSESALNPGSLFLRRATPYSTESENDYYDLRERVKQAQLQLRRSDKAGDEVAVRRALAAYEKELRPDVAEVIKAADRDIEAMRDDESGIRSLRDAGEIDPAEARSVLNDIRAARQQLTRRAVDLLREIGAEP